MKRPSFQFYPSDWLRDPALRACTTGARGMWMDMLCYMHEGQPYGYLKVGGKVILIDNLARMVGATLHDAQGWLDELIQFGVCSIDEDGAIFSRRMIRDEEIREKRAAGGFKGGNPTLKKATDKVNLDPNLKPTPSSSSSLLTTPTQSAGAGEFDSESGLKAGFSLVPDDFTPPEHFFGMLSTWGVHCTQEQMGEQLREFVSHYQSERKASADWTAKFRQWLQRAQRMGHFDAKRSGQSGGKSPPAARPKSNTPYEVMS